MRARIGATAVALAVVLGAPSAARAALAYRKPITVPATSVQGGADLASFPLLVSLAADPSLRSTTNGGRVYRADGGDIQFRAADGTTVLDHEIEDYDPVTGTLVAWVRVPVLSASTATTVYVYYGDVGQPCGLQNPAGVWSPASYSAVYHQKSTVDSGPLAQDAVDYGTTSAAGQIGQARALAPATLSYEETASTELQSATSFTLSAWIRTNDVAGPHHILWQGSGEANGWGELAAAATNQEMHLSLGDIPSGAGTLSFFLGSANRGADPNVLSLVTPFADTTAWHHVAVVVETLDTAPTAQLFLDGVPVAFGTGTVGSTSRANWDTPLRIGRPGDAERTFDGAIDEVRVATVARTAGWIATERANQAAPLAFYTVGAEDASSPVPANGCTAAGTPGADGALTVAGTQVLNRYAELAADAPRGSTSLTVVDATTLAPLAPGDLLLVVQMQGATVDENPTSPRFGTVTSLGNAGRYELATVASVAGNVIGLRCARGLRQAYTVAGRAQVVRVPQHTNLTVNGRVAATPWNGATGGVVALRADTIAVGGGASIDANAAGFRGGAYEFGDGSGLTDFGYFSPIDAGRKGEGIAAPGLTYLYGRGASANGGGGGDGHNSGGGGGANAAAGPGWCIGPSQTAASLARCGQGVPDPAFAAPWALDPTLLGTPVSSGGGRGGYTWASAAADPGVVPPGDAAWVGDLRREVGGRGGHPAPGDASSRIFLGGGGGAGHANTNPIGDGGAGGGIVLLLVRSLGGSGTIAADGAPGGSTTLENRDGPSGGGAGGTVVIQASGRVDATLSIHASGGAGGDQPVSSTVPDFSFGPGGGGGGGLVTIASPQLLATPVAAGGVNGQSGSPSVAAFTPNGATSGASGLVRTGTEPLAIPGDCLATAVVGGTCPTGTIPSGVNLVTNGSFASGAVGFVSGIALSGLPGRPLDTSYSIRTGRECYDTLGNPMACPGTGIDQLPFPGDAAVYAPAASTWMWVNGNSTGGPYLPWEQTVTGLTPGTTYLFSFHASNAYAPGRTDTVVPLLQARLGGALIGPDFEVAYETAAQGDTWTRFATTFTAGAASATLSIFDTALGTNGDEWALTAIGLQACAIPTAVTLASFEAQAGDGAVALSWTTASELDNAGFHVYRGLSASGPWQRLDAAMIPGLGSSPTGRAYSWMDRGLVNGITYFYRLEDLDTSGRATSHGPVAATPQAGAVLPAPVGTDAAEGGDDDAAVAGAVTATAAPRAYGRPEDHGVTIVERGPSHVVVELRTGGFWATPHSDGSVRVEAPGLVLGAAPGAPGVPVRTVWLDAVPGRGVALGAVRARDTIAFDLRPEAAGRPEMTTGRDGLPRVRVRRRAEGPAFAAVFPAEAARLVETGFLGGAKKARLEIAPLRWDAARRGLVLARRVRVRVDFAGREAGERAGRHGRWLRRPRCTKPSDRSLIARLEVALPGLYAVRYEDLPPGTRPFAPGDLRLLRRGEPVAFHVEPAGGSFGPGGTLHFLSAGASLNPEGGVVYELARGTGGHVMETWNGAPVASPALAAAWTTTTFETNFFYQPGLLDAPDLWLWDAVGMGATKAYPFTVSPVAAGAAPTARLVVDLQGATDDPAVDFDHHLAFRLNGTPIGQALWEGKAPYHAAFDVPASLLASGTGRLEIEGLADTGASVGLVFLDKFSVTWPRALAADGGGRFEAAFDRDGTAIVAGLADALVLETSGPRWIDGAVAAPGSVAFAARAGGHYLAVASSAVLRPVVHPVADTGLRKPSAGADWLLVAPRGMLDAARPLVERRAAQGLRARAVAVEDVYDEFGFGEHSAAAVRAFLVHAYQEWPQPGPRYVVLLGDATADPKDYTGAGRKDLVPTPVVRTPYLWTASDPGYAAVNGDDALPDLAIGRLPAGTVEEAAALVAKVLEYEAAGRGVDGRQVLVADNPDVGGDFEAQAEAVAAALPAGRAVERIYLTRLGGATKTAILDAFDAGAAVVSYVGHGAAATWASEAVLTSFDVPSLRPQAEQPVVLTLNCLNGYFVAPSFDALGEALAKVPGRGAIAAVSPSGLSLDAPSHQLHLALERQLLSPANRTLGDAFLAAQADYAQGGGPTDVLAVYHLFGDPGLRLR